MLFSKVSADTIAFFFIMLFLRLTHLPQLVTGTRRYLDMFDWNLDDAIRSAKEDGDWEQDVEPESGSIHISVKLQNGIPVDFQATGAGLKPQPKAVSTKPVTYDGLPAIATKNVRPQDVYNVSVHLLAMDVSTFLSK